MLCMVSVQYGNDEVQFEVNIPWKGNGIDDGHFYNEVLEYLEENFGLDPMTSIDSWTEWE